MLEHLRWIKHSSFLWQADRTVYVDPWGLPDGLPPADAILITHPHFDHFSAADVAKIRTERTTVWGPPDVARELGREINVVTPGDAFEVAGYPVDAVPAYNVRPGREGLHPRDRRWVGYVLAVDGVRYYHAGDTDQIPEMDAIDCDVALLPIGGVYTMDVEEAAGAAKAIGPSIVVPMHYGYIAGRASDAARLAEALAPLEIRFEILAPAVPADR